MPQAKTTSSPQDDIEQLSAQIATLKKDIAEISTTLGDLGIASRDAAISRTRQKAAELREAGEEQLTRAQKQAEALGHQANDAIRDQPAAAMGLAVGLGFLLGFLTGRK
ncbi:MAG: YqjD family protein [Qingshengfaniella sp.]